MATTSSKTMTRLKGLAWRSGPDTCRYPNRQGTISIFWVLAQMITHQPKKGDSIINDMYPHNHLDTAVHDSLHRTRELIPAPPITTSSTISVAQGVQKNLNLNGETRRISEVLAWEVNSSLSLDFQLAFVFSRISTPENMSGVFLDEILNYLVAHFR